MFISIEEMNDLRAIEGRVDLVGSQIVNSFVIKRLLSKSAPGGTFLS